VSARAPTRTLMLQGTASHVGKTLLVAALCRIFRDAGWRVAPFKAQNMALNAYVTAEGGEIGWAQALQAEAARVPPRLDMNPLLLKPEPGGSQVIVHGRVRATLSAAAYYARRAELWEAVVAAYRRLAADFELVVIEGAGSPAEPNLMAHDLANMAVARLARAPVVLVGDIDRGGVFASLTGSLAILPPGDRRRVRGFVLNRFRGDPALLAPALAWLERRSGRPVFGVVPAIPDLRLPEEDSVALDERARDPAASGPRGAAEVLVVRLPHVANFTDFQALAADAAFRVRYARAPDELDDRGHPPDLVVLPGSKATLADLRWLRATGWAEALRAHAARGGRLAGVCGGFQMLGERIEDPAGAEGGGAEPGLGWLPVVTVLAEEKVTRRVRARLAPEAPVFEAYEIHLGRTHVAPGARPRALVEDGAALRPDGAVSADGRVWGTYLHGLFDAVSVRAALLRELRVSAIMTPQGDYASVREAEYARLAAVVSAHVDVAALLRLAERGGGLARAVGWTGTGGGE
jgi:adenosylcobyric acid synthase